MGAIALAYVDEDATRKQAVSKGVGAQRWS